MAAVRGPDDVIGGAVRSKPLISVPALTSTKPFSFRRVFRFGPWSNDDKLLDASGVTMPGSPFC